MKKNKDEREKNEKPQRGSNTSPLPTILNVLTLFIMKRENCVYSLKSDCFLQCAPYCPMQWWNKPAVGVLPSSKLYPNEYQPKGQQRSVCQNQSAMNAKLKSLSENPHKPPIAGDCLRDRTVSMSPSGFPAHFKFSSETPALSSLTLEEQATLPPWRFSDLLLKAFLPATLLFLPLCLPQDSSLCPLSSLC